MKQSLLHFHDSERSLLKIPERWQTRELAKLDELGVNLTCMQGVHMSG